ADKVEAFYEQIKDHSSIEIELPFADQFWGGKMGIFTDKYGVRWMLHGQDYTAIQQ
ncbi:VOC family protein, partial [Staphylococcus aureus]|nr:VOC family protein [Staphylococcus aureus]